MIRQLPCIRCRKEHETEAAHLRYGNPERGKPPTGVSEKPDDGWTLPLCGGCHKKQHGMSERKFWEEIGIDPIAVCLCLVQADTVAEMETIIFRAIAGRTT